MKFKFKVGEVVRYHEENHTVYQKRIYFNCPYYRLDDGSIVHEDRLY